MIVAIVNNYVIFEKEYNAELCQMLIEENRKSITDRDKDRALYQLIDVHLLLGKVQKENYKIDEQLVYDNILDIMLQFPSKDEFEKMMTFYNISIEDLGNLIRDNLLVKLFIKKKFYDRIHFHKQQIRRFCKTHSEFFTIPEKLRIRHILIKGHTHHSFEKVNEIYDMIKNGYGFAFLAQRYSDCPSRKIGGDLGYFIRGKMLPSFEKAALSLSIGEISKPVRTYLGYHIIQLIDKIGCCQLRFDKVVDVLKKRLERIQAEIELLKYIKKLRDTAKITINYPIISKVRG